jgi:hypothetical protein
MPTKMKSLLLSVAFLLFFTSSFAQRLSSEWERVYTFDDSIIEINTANVIIGGNIAFMKFRWTFDQPQDIDGESQLKYKSRLEVFEFNCTDKRFRPTETALLDSAGKIIHHEKSDPQTEWRTTSGIMMDQLMASACELMKRKLNPPASQDEIESQRVAKYAFSLSQRLEQTKDLKPIVEQFFVDDYLNRYLSDRKSNWFWNLNRETAARASRSELQRFYIAVLNTGYLNCQYYVSQYAHAPRGSFSEEKLIPADIIELIERHPYTARYKGKEASYDYLAENINSIERLRSYTDLLEKVSALMRAHVVATKAEHSQDYQAILEDWDLYLPKVRTCNTECLGLPKGTRLFEVNVPVFRLQVAEIKGKLRVVSATDLFQ